MEWQLNIPKILHVYWGGGPINYLRFLTIKTFMKYNPDWKIRFLYPKYFSKNKSWLSYENKDETSSYKNFTQEVFDLPITKTDIDFRDFGIDNSISEVHKSDFIRLHQLSTFGGVWSDMDIIYVRPMNDFYLNTPENKDIETFICNNDYGHSIGFMMASEGNKFFKTLGEYAIKEYEPTYYQTIGARLYNKYFYTMDSINAITPAINFSLDVVYPHIAGNEEKILYGTVSNFTDRTLGVHWYAGHSQWKNFILQTNGGLENLPNTLIGKLIKDNL